MPGLGGDQIQVGGGGGGVADHGLLTGLSDNDHTNYQLSSAKGAANGYAGLDAEGGLPVAQVDLPEMAQFLMRTGSGGLLHEFGSFVEAVTGTGVTQTGARLLSVDTGTTAGSTALLNLDLVPGYSIGSNRNVINWSKPTMLRAMFSNVLKTTNGIFRMTLGNNPADAFGVLDDKGIGFEIRNAALWGVVHDGSTLTTVDLSTTLTDNIVTDVTVVSDGAGNIEWFVNQVSGGTSALAPTGDSTSLHFAVRAGVLNGADSARQLVQTHQINLLFGA